MSDIFLSYASQDLDWAKVLASALVSEGWSVFYDRTIPPGKTWRQFIGKHTEECSCMVVVWSQHSINSRWVLEEADIALERNILIPVFLDQVKPPFGFVSIQAANLINWQGNKDSPGFLALCTVITELIGAEKLLLPEQAFSPTKVIPSAETNKKLRDDNNVPIMSSAASKNIFIEPEMVVIPPGRFEMGSDSAQDEKPIHTVNFAKPFSIAEHCVTFDEYELFVKTNNRKMPSDQRWGGDKRPVINVSWEDAVAYARWLSMVSGKAYRLPSEAEWEYAARAGSQADYYWGDNDAKNYAWFCDNSNNQTQPVGQLKPNDFGLYDMSGNVWEWVQDCFAEDYSQAPKDGSAWEPKDCAKSRVLRGGSWINRQGSLRSAYRIRDYPGTLNYFIGFRLAQD